MTRSPRGAGQRGAGSPDRRGSSRQADHRPRCRPRSPAARTPDASLAFVGAIGRGELKAVAPLIKLIDRLDKHQETVVAKYDYGPEERQRPLDKVNRSSTISSRPTARRPRR